MYVDETGGAEEIVPTDHMTVPGDGDGGADLEAEYDAGLDADGEYDASVAYHEDGTPDCYTGGDLDGTAEAHHDTPPDPAGTPMHAWMPPDGEEIRIPAPTIDSDDDGVPDTSVVADADGTTYLFTDGDHDGQADYVMITYADGAIEAYEHCGGGEWRLVEPEEPEGSDESGGSGTDPAIVAAFE